MKKTITVLSLVASLFAASSVPAATASLVAPEPPATCTSLATDLAAKLKKLVESLLAPPDAGAVAPLIGDLLAIVTAMQNAGCLPKPPVSAPAVPQPAAPAREAPSEQCLAAVLNLISSIAGLGGTVLGAVGGTQLDPAKVTEQLKTVLKNADDLLARCGLPAPPGGVPAAPGAPLPAQHG
ncbi:hypothetical protein [Nocardia sp. NRRL S-836]|uniref:hypothetical protein n=1 Tax=Nocardia sp. NRRL S-836 TaxID=1519492 RepID=UPI0006AFCAC3|nr:hypothetical protein [Nocardia sp. NRRL S-836]KOV79806.1 hypothetical protein ADL03_35685 [Nocardia sp. NRRL S-836]